MLGKILNLVLEAVQPLGKGSAETDYQSMAQWANKVNEILPELKELAKEGSGGDIGDVSEDEKRLTELVFTKMRLSEFKGRLSDSGVVTKNNQD